MVNNNHTGNAGSLKGYKKVIIGIFNNNGAI